MTPDSPDPSAPLRWGILGAARIAAKALVPAIRSAGGEILAVGASSLDRARLFAQSHHIPTALHGYQPVLDDDRIDAVYLPLANGLHLEWALKAARAGKACLCEKPLALAAADARELRRAFLDAGRRLQEAFMWRHHPQTLWAAEQLAAGAIGPLQRLSASFSFTLDRPDDYRWRADQGGGALWDIGCYPVNAARFFFAAEPLEISVRARFRPPPNPVDESAAGWLDFGNGRLATLACSFTAAFEQGLELLGAHGRLWISKPWLQAGQPSRVLLERDGQRSSRLFPPADAYAEMVRAFSRAARDPSFSLRPGEDGVAQAEAMDGVLASARAHGALWKAQI